MVRVIRAQAGNGEVAGFTTVLGIYVVVPLGKVLCARFSGSVVKSKLFEPEDRHMQQNVQSNARISQSGSGQCMLPYVLGLMFYCESGGYIAVNKQ